MLSRRQTIDRIIFLALGIAIGIAGASVARKSGEPMKAPTEVSSAKEQTKAPAPTRKTASFDPPIRAALEFLGIAEVGEDVASPVFNFRVRKDVVTKQDLEELDKPDHGWTRFKDFEQLPESIPVHCVTFQQGFSDTTVLVSETGRVLLVKIISEG